ncbi:hypothetical protein F310043J5_07630 [Anaerostipes hominis (ex Lee et al. 2021)]
MTIKPTWEITQNSVSLTAYVKLWQDYHQIFELYNSKLRTKYNHKNICPLLEIQKRE